MSIYKGYSPEDAKRYSGARPECPPALFDLLRERCNGQDLAWDCATGNGQATIRLADWFRRVVATDASRGQLASRRTAANVQYALARAERAPLADESADLVTVAQALHWFDLPAFFAEAQRVLKPCGLLASWCFFLPLVDREVDAAVSRLYQGVLKGYMPPQIELLSDRYRTVSPSSGEVFRTEIEMTETWDLDRFTLYLET